MTESCKAAMILAAGLGTRLGRLTQNRPKALLEINGRSLMEINLRRLESLGYEYIVLNTHHFHDQIEAFLSTFSSRMTIRISHEPDQPLETGGGLLKALPWLEGQGQVLVHNVDVVTDIDFDPLHNMLRLPSTPAVLAVSNRPSARRLLFDEDYCLAGWKNTLTGEVRQVPGRSIKHSLAFSAISCVNPMYFKSFEVRSVSLVDLLLSLAETHEVRGALAPYSYWHDLGKAEQLMEIEASLKEKFF